MTSSHRSRVLCPARTVAVVAALACSALASSPRAQGDSAAARAIAKGQEGLALFEQGKKDEALSSFRQAEVLYHSPVFLLYAGRSLRAIGRLTEARATLRRVDEETIPATAPAPWKQAQADARGEIATLAAEIPSVVVNVVGGSTGTRVTIDGTPAVAGQRIELDPGPHVVVATDDERHEAKTVTLAPRAETESVVITLSPAAVQAHADHALAPPPVGDGPPSRAPTAGLVTIGAGGVLIVAGGVVGVLALVDAKAARRSLPDTCDGTTCPSSRKDEVEGRLDAARRLGIASDVLFVSGGVAAAIGIYVVIAHPRVTKTLRGTPRGASFEMTF